MKFFSSFILAGLALAAMPALPAEYVTLAGVADTYSSGLLQQDHSNNDTATMNWNDPDFILYGQSSVIMTATGFEFKGSLDANLIYSQGISDSTGTTPWLKVINQVFVGGFPTSDGLFAVTGTEYRDSSDGVNNGLVHINDTLGPVVTSGGYEFFQPEFSLDQNGVGHQFLEYDLFYTPIGTTTSDPAATPEPSTWAMMMFPLLALVGFKVRSRFTPQ